MLTIRIANLQAVQDEFRSIRADQIPYATMLAVKNIAYAAQRRIRDVVLPAHFILRRVSWMKQNIRVDQPTKQNLTAAVRDTYPAMGLQESGGIKIPYGSAICVPLSGARPSPASLIKPENLPSAIMARGGFIQGNIMFDVSLKAGRRSPVGRRIKGILRAANWSRQVIPMYALVKQASIPQRYGFEDAVVDTVTNGFEATFAAAFKQAVRTAR